MEMIGGVEKRITESFQRSHPEMSWRNIIGRRNVLTHEYGEVQNERTWGVATKRIPKLIA